MESSSFERLPGQNPLEIWEDIGLYHNIDSTKNKLDKFIGFIALSIEKNHILEMGYGNRGPVFSGDSPSIVANRIFSDFPISDLPHDNPESSNIFTVYMVSKLSGWAVLVNGH